MKNAILWCAPAIIIAAVVIFFWYPGLIIELLKHVSRWKAGLSRHEVRVDDHGWVYLGGGEGEAVILLHGFGGEKDRWVDFLQGFDRRRFRVVVPDLPGFGESSYLPGSSYDICGQVTRLDRFVERIGLERFHIIGVSMGGCIAGVYAAQHPDKVMSLCLMDAAGVRSPVSSELSRLRQEQQRSLLVVRDADGFKNLVSFMFYQPPRLPERFAACLGGQAAARSRINAKILNDIRKDGEYLLEDRLSDLTMRTLVMWGADDRIFHVSTAEKTNESLPRCQSVIIGQCGHLPYQEKPAEAQKIYFTFLAAAS